MSLVVPGQVAHWWMSLCPYSDAATAGMVPILGPFNLLVLMIFLCTGLDGSGSCTRVILESYITNYVVKFVGPVFCADS